MPSLDEALGTAYHRSVAGDNAGAVAILREITSTDRDAAVARRASLAAVVAARTQGQRCHAHIEKVQCALLDEALNA